jgi:hypothetical protein
MNKRQKCFYLLIHETKHETKHSLHSTYEGADNHRISIAIESLEIWKETDKYKNYTNSDIVSNWREISGGECFNIVEVQMLEKL